MSGIRKEVQIGECRLILGDCLEILPTLGKVDAVLTDPPYGMGALLSGGKSRWSLHDGGAETKRWDSQPADLTDLLALQLPTIVWGGQFFSLPVRRGWLVWDKLMSEFSTSVCELAWTNLEFPVKRLNYGSAMVQREGRVHPTQKPIELMKWCLGFLPDANTILDPFMGSGTTGVACVKAGRSFIGIEIDEGYFDISAKRIQDAYDRPDMFIEAARAPEPKQEAFL